MSCETAEKSQSGPGVIKNNLTTPIAIENPPKPGRTIANVIRQIGDNNIEILKIIQHPGYTKLYAGSVKVHNSIMQILEQEGTSFTQMQNNYDSYKNSNKTSTG